MFWEIFLFELKFRFKRISPYVYFGVFFFFTFLAVSVPNFGPGGQGKVMVNSPFGLANIIGSLTSFGTILISGLFGTAILRDFEDNIYQMLFTKPLRKSAYLGGRFLGSLVATLFCFSGLIAGCLAGPFMPWADTARLAPFHLWHLLQPWLVITLVQTLFCGAIFFAFGALTRSLVFVYLQGVVFFVIYLIGAVYVINNRENLNTFWPSVLDPLGLISMDTITRYWTVAEKNTMTLPLEGVLLWNRLLWLSIGAIAFGVMYRLFPFSAEALTMSSKKAAKQAKVVEEEEPAVRVPTALGLPRVSQQFGAGAVWAQYLSMTRLRLMAIVKEIPFWAIVFIMTALFVINGNEAGRLGESPVWPVTYLMAGMLQGAFLFFIIIATMYAGELVWKDRELRFEQIQDATPAPTGLQVASQFSALALIIAVLLAALIAIGCLIQASLGYYRFELPVYFSETFGLGYVFLLQFVAFALVMHHLLPNKFVAHGIVIGVNVLAPIVSRWGFQDNLYLLFSNPSYTYSDMNGYGHFVAPLVWFYTYWNCFALAAMGAAVLWTRRGTDVSWGARWREAQARMKSPAGALALLGLISFAGVGGYIYYNTHILNPFRNGDTVRAMQADYEKKYKKYEWFPQPKVVGVEVECDIYPEKRSFAARGVMKLENRTGAPVNEIHLTDGNESFREISFSRAFTTKVADKRLGFYIYALTTPLAPGESIELRYRVGHEPKGFKNDGERNELAHNGTFFDQGYFPAIGYSRGGELSDENRRKENGLKPQADMPAPDSEIARRHNLFNPDSDWITFKAKVSTSPEQIAIAPGYLQREWRENGRRYFEYSMGDTLIANFYSFVSGRYAVKKDQWKDIPIEVYYHPGHEYNIARMIDATKKGFDYFTANFGPYQFKQYRIIEFPRYRGFAQSFPNTVPYSEGLGFIARVEKEEDVDMTFYVTAHELAHQWWGHQAVGGFAQGSNMMSESLAQYSAFMVVEKEYKAEGLRRYLKRELDGYLRGRGAERRKEPPMTLVQNEPYVWYQKGSLVMYALKDYLGEERVNAALKKWLEQVKFRSAPYTNSYEFVKTIREFTPPEQQQMVTDLFEQITLFDNRAVEATWRKTADQKYAVKLKLDTRKLRADGLGAEKEIAINDWIDIAIFKGEKKTEKPLYFAKRQINRNQSEIEIIVEEEPSRAGVDPYNKLIDRKPEDNVIAVAKGS